MCRFFNPVTIFRFYDVIIYLEMNIALYIMYFLKFKFVIF